MKKSFRNFQIGTIILGAGSFLSFAGALASTVAWYAYSSNAQIAFNGTSVAKTEQLQVGIKTDIEFTDELVEQYGLTEVTIGEDEDSIRYVFAAPGMGLDSTIIKYYLSETGYAGITLVPVSSQSYSLDDDLKLYTSPKSGDNILGKEAQSDWYCKLPLAFRVIKNNSDIFVKEQNIWLTDATCVADGEGEIFKSVRTHFDNGNSKFILNPTELGSSRSTVVGGLLDLNEDGYYDSSSLFDSVTGDEIIYGQYSGNPERTFNEEDSDIVDINNTGNSDEITTFTAKHRRNNNIYSSYEGITFEEAEYYAMEDIAPLHAANGMLSGGIPITTTSNDDAAIADVTLTVYIEGWDHSVIDNQIGYGFDLGLTFEINRVE